MTAPAEKFCLLQALRHSWTAICCELSHFGWSGRTTKEEEQVKGSKVGEGEEERAENHRVEEEEEEAWGWVAGRVRESKATSLASGQDVASGGHSDWNMSLNICTTSKRSMPVRVLGIVKVWS
jgi:hypothetical protein